MPITIVSIKIQKVWHDTLEKVHKKYSTTRKKITNSNVGNTCIVASFDTPEPCDYPQSRFLLKWRNWAIRVGTITGAALPVN